MEAQRLTEAREHAEEIVNKQSMEFLKRVLADDVVHHTGPPQLDTKEMFTALLQTCRNDFVNAKINVEDVIKGPDQVVIRWSLRGTYQGPLIQASARGKEVTISGATIVRLAEGQVKEMWNFADTDALLRQLGIGRLKGV